MATFNYVANNGDIKDLLQFMVTKTQPQIKQIDFHTTYRIKLLSY